MRSLQRLVAILVPLLRFALALALVYFCALYWRTTQARAEFAALPDYDFVAAADAERNGGHYGEALLIVDAGLDTLPGEQQAELLALQTRIVAERDALLTRLREAGHGALTGTGESAEALTGAVIADLMVVGDVRDLVIQGARALRGEETDEVIVALSTLGLATTLAPEVDGGVSVLKFARRIGALGDAFVKNLVKLLRRAVETGDTGAVAQVAGDAVRLTQIARPAGAMKIIRLVDDPESLHLAADFAARPGGAFALWLGRERALAWLKAAGPEGRRWLLRASAKGEAGVDLLTRNGALLLRAHPLLGLIKSVYAGRLPALLLSLLDAHSAALLGVAFAWMLYESVLLVTRLRRSRTAPIATA